MCLMTGMAMAQVQSEKMTLTPVKKGDEPKQVMEAIKKDFPKAIASDLSFLPAELYGEKWSVSFKNDLDEDAVFYHVTLKEGKETYRAAYDKDGNILSAKYEIPEAKLPKEVTNAILAKHPQWSVINDVERITYKKGGIREVFRIQIRQDDKYRSLFVTVDGTIMKDKLVNHST